MDCISFGDRKQQRAEKHGSECRRIVAAFKMALTQDRLSAIETATNHLHDNPGDAPEIVARLNSSIGRSSLSFRWYPGNNRESNKLLIRNKSIGLLIKMAPGSMPAGIKMTLNEDESFSSLTPESALSLLSVHARKQSSITKMTPRKLRRNIHLQVSPDFSQNSND